MFSTLRDPAQMHPARKDRLNLPIDFARACFHRVRQSRLAVGSWEEFAARRELRGASLALVGNAGYLSETEQGEHIDRHDIVIRMNNFRLDGFERRLGRRTDVLLTNFYKDIDYANPAFREAPCCVSSVPNTFWKTRRLGIRHRHAEHITRGMRSMNRRAAFAPSLEWFLGVMKCIGRYPTTGACGVLLILDHLLPLCGDVYITGFSFFDCRSHYFSDFDVDPTTNHNVANERRLISQRLLPHVESGRIQIDPTMQGVLERKVA